MLTHINRTTKTGGLPNITYVQRKPKPLGTEFKCFVDAITKIMLYIEVQEGKVRMSSKPHFANLGATASCVMRCVNAGNQFTAFPDTSKFVPHLHGNKPRPKDPPLDEDVSVSSEDSSGESTGLSPLLVGSPAPSFTQKIVRRRTTW